MNTLNNHFFRVRKALFAVALLALLGSIPAQAQSLNTDIDADGISNGLDNCTLTANPTQIDADDDGYGNLCDADLNNDGIVNFGDFALFVERFLSAEAVADLNSDGVVNFGDLALFAAQFLNAPGPSGAVASNLNFQATRVFQGIDTSGVIDLKQAPGQPGRWYLLRRDGQIVSFPDIDTAIESTQVLDIVSQVSTTFEGGALGMAFDPDFANNGFVYVSYTAAGPSGQVPLISRISRFATTLSAGVSVADPDSELVLMSVDQPYANHNGGGLEFGPDGFLYWGLGDGGSSGDPQQNGQNLQTRLGKMLRIDVNITQSEIDQGVTYKIPADNPFASSASCGALSQDSCPEIFAWGLRNPWRWSFDQATGLLWVGDVGQNTIEEISIVRLGRNYGWRCYEGNQIYNTFGCDLGLDFEAPQHTYTHALGYSVTGGYVYRGAANPSLHGMYIFGDYGSGTIWGIYEGDYIGPLLSTGSSIVSFAQDANGELYFLDLGFFTHGIYRIDVN